MWVYIAYDDLYHSGIKGQKWGQNRYQNPDGTWTEEGLARRREREGNGGDSSTGSKPKRPTRRERREEKRRQEQRAASLEKARQAKQAKKEHEENRDRVLKTGTAKEIMAYKGEISNQEYSEILTRLDNEAKLAKKAYGDEKSKWDKIAEAGENISKATKFAESAISAYNTFTKVYNSLSDTPLPALTGDKDKGEQKRTYGQKEAERVLKLMESNKITPKELNQEMARLGNIGKLEKQASGKGN